MKKVFFNGIRADNGKYAFPEVPLQGLARHLVSRSPLRRKIRARRSSGRFISRFFGQPGLPLDHPDHTTLIAPLSETEKDNLATAGWGVLYPEGEKETLLNPLSPLLDLRRQQAGPLYKEIAYLPGQSLAQVLEANGAPQFQSDPTQVPYYLMVVGSPSQIPFSIQYGLDRQFAVGRLDFDDPIDYGHYAQTVAERESARVSQLETTLFGTRHPGEATTELLADFLVKKLKTRMANSLDPVHYSFATKTEEKATKNTLARLMGGSLTPDLLLTATHGLILPPSTSDRMLRQGALLTAEYPGTAAWNGNPIPPRMIFSGGDIKPEADFNGMLALVFACYGGGTPERSSFPLEPHLPGSHESYRPFVANLPKRMLAGRRGCRAVIAHVDNAYIWAFTDASKREQTETFQAFFRGLLEGRTIGFAMDVFQRAHLEKLAQYRELVEAFNEDHAGVEDDRLVQAWFAVNDLRNYILLGDPAVRLPAIAA